MEPAEFKNQVWALMRDITDRMNGVFHPIIDRYGLTIMQKIGRASCRERV